MAIALTLRILQALTPKRGASPAPLAITDNIVADDVPTPINAYFREDWAPIVQTIADVLARPDDVTLRARADQILRAQRDGGWSLSGKGTRDRQLCILQHTALVAMVRSRRFIDDPALMERLQKGLRASWRHLTGKVPSDGHLLAALPLGVRMFANAVVKDLHAAGVAGSKDGTSEELARAIRRFTEDADYLDAREISLGLLAFVLTPRLMAGLVLGYLVWSVAEALLHERHYHASKEAREIIDRYLPAKLSRMFDDARRQHNVHHGFFSDTKGGTNYVTPLDVVDPGAAERLRATLEADGVGWIAEEEFGATFGAVTTVLYGLPTMPAFLLAGAGLLSAGGGGVGLAGLAVAGVLGPVHTTVTHRYLHMTDDGIRARAPKLLWPYLFGRHFCLMRRLHGVHHTTPKTKDDRTVDNQIVPGSLGDILLGTLTNGTREQRRKLREWGL